MATTTPNFGWSVPTSTDLVKDGATAIETLGDSIDASLVDLKGGTTGQVLAKNSNTDMDFTWTAIDPLVILDAKGDLITATAADTPARLAVGTNGQVLTADSSAATGLAWSTVSVATSLGFTAGKNKLINGDFNINQRAFTSLTCSGTDQYGFDRWLGVGNTGTVTYSTQAFTAGTAPVTGYEGTNFARMVTSGQSGVSAYAILSQKIESVRTFANQTITVSFWAKAATGTPKIAIEMSQGFGSGGSAQTNTYAGQATISTSWARYSVTVAVPSISGKTIGAGDSLAVNMWFSSGTALDSRTGSIGIQSGTFDIWGVQAEAGSTATSFQTASGSLGGELALCQRYYYRASATDQAYARFGIARASSTTNLEFCLVLPVTMRVFPSAVEFSSLTTTNAQNVSAAALSSPSRNAASIDLTVGSATTNQPYTIMANNSTSAYVAVTAEL
jgi:hypothetical protein